MLLPPDTGFSAILTRSFQNLSPLPGGGYGEKVSTKDERKPDGGLQDWIDVLEAESTGSSREESELLMLLIELRRRREDSRQPGGKGNM